MNDPVREYCLRMGYANHVIRGGMRYLVDIWESVVESVVNGEPQGLCEYLNDMDGRQILEEVKSITTSEQKAELFVRIDIADRRFLAVAIPTQDCIGNEEYAISQGWTREKQWWYFHRPPNINEDDWSS